MKARLVRISIEATANRLYATSSDLPGLFVSEKSPEALEAALPSAIELIFAADGIRVQVSELEGMDAAGYRRWVAFPAHGAVSENCV